MNKNQSILTVEDKGETLHYQKTEIDSEYAYKVGIKELQDIFDSGREDIFKTDTSNCLTLITKSGKEISLHEYKSGVGIKFIKLTDDILTANNSEIIINLKYLVKIPVSMNWADNNYRCSMNRKCYKNDLDAFMNISDDVMNNIDGYSICQEMIEYCKNNDKDIPGIISYCDGLSETINGKTYKGYLPSLYQMMTICKNFVIIKYVAYRIITGYTNISPAVFRNTVRYWTANEYNDEKVWIVMTDINDEEKTTNGYFPAYKNATESIYRSAVHPLFRQFINDER